VRDSSGNRADEQPRAWRFRVGDALPADDPLARFILVVAVGLNDNILVNSRFVEAEEQYELLYYFQLASGHLYELAATLRRAHDEWPEVREFVAALQQQYRVDFAATVRLAEPGDATGRTLRRFRNGFFHYPALKRSTAERRRLPLRRALRQAADTEGTLTVGGGLGGGIRAHFADELVAQLMMAGREEDEIRALLAQLGELQAAYNRFAQAALGRYLNGLPEGIVTEVTTD
jgi:hypothetical protein